MLENVDDSALQWRKRGEKHSSERGTDNMSDNRRTAEAQGGVEHGQAYQEKDLMGEGETIDGQVATENCAADAGDM